MLDSFSCEYAIFLRAAFLQNSSSDCFCGFPSGVQQTMLKIKFLVSFFPISIEKLSIASQVMQRSFCFVKQRDYSPVPNNRGGEGGEILIKGGSDR